MKLTVFLVLFSVVGVFASKSYSQTKTLNLNMREVTVKEVLTSIEKQSEFYFLFSENLIDVKRKVNVTLENKKIEQALDLLFEGTDVDYDIRDRIIVLTTPEVTGNDLFVQQQNTVSGTVTDENGQPLPGVTVIVKGTTQGTVTNADGNYSLSNIPEDATLQFSFVGMRSQEIPVGGNHQINVTLQEETIGLGEVVAVGYGTQMKKDITGSISSVEATKLESRPVASAEEALQGIVPGLNIAQRSASPGDLGTVSIRGLGSITAGTSPLWVIDGFPTDQRNAQSINPDDIQSIDVLKDASSTAIYGSRGANGVIIITTKSGKAGKSTLNVNVNGGIAMPDMSHIHVLNAAEYVQYHKEQNGGTIPDFIANYWDGKTDTNWLDQVFRNGIFQNYEISSSGGDEKVTYFLSAGYLSQNGIVKGEEYDKYSARLKVDYKPIERVTLGLNIAPNYSIIGRNGPAIDGGDWSSVYSQALLMAPIVPIYRPDGTYSMNSDLVGALPIGNPLETMQNYDYSSDLFRMIANLYGQWEVTDGLTLKTSVSTNLGTDKSETYYWPTVGQTVPQGMSAVSFYNVGQSQSLSWLNENTVNYKKVVKNHSFDILGGFTFQKYSSESVSASVRELQVPGVRNVNIGNSDTRTGSNGSSGSSLISYLGRLNYGFKDKYLFTGTVRRDGSSVFGSQNQYKTFTSFALGWRFSEEPFMQSFNNLNLGKLRFSYGNTGSNAIPPFASRATLNVVDHSFGSSTVFGTTLGNPGNNYLTWETSKQLDAGLDLNMFDNRLSLVLDYFNNKTTSLLLTKNVVPSSGYSSFLTNIGSMRNKGVELTLNLIVVNNKDWEWSVGGNLTTNDQEILDLGGDQEILNFFGALRRVVGAPLQQMYGPKVIGIAREGDDQSAQPLKTPGAIIYQDVDGNGSISNFLGPDAQPLGDTNLDLVYGLNTNVRYKNFELNVLLNGQAGASVYDFWQIQIAAPFRRTNLSRDYWFEGRYIDESNPGDGKTPAANGFDAAIAPVSGIGVQKTDYLRIRNITLTYHLPKSLLQNWSVSNARIYTSVENIYTFTNYVGGNTEARRQSAGGPALIGGSQIASVTDGRELGLNSPPGLPLPITWTMGISFNF